MNTLKKHYEIAIIGSGLAGISSAYYLCKKYKTKSIVLIDPKPALSFTSAQSGNNYRNWWPHSTMTALANRSIDLLREIAQASQNTIKLKQSGYLLATRNEISDKLLNVLSYAHLREHTTDSSKNYQHSLNKEWPNDVSGVDILSNKNLIQKHYPSFSTNLKNLIHLRRAGDIDGQALGQYMLSYIKSQDGNVCVAKVVEVQSDKHYKLILETQQNSSTLNCDVIVNAAGPFVKQVSNMLGRNIEVKNYYQQKILLADEYKLIPRDLPFSIDIDEQFLKWTDEEIKLLSTDPKMRWLLNGINGSVHCRPEGGENNNWLKLGWAYNTLASETPQDDLINDPHYDSSFPEIVLRGASNLNPNLRKYIESMPTDIIHYGGYYTMTEENWPLIGKLDNKSAYIIGALSGFGTMMACAAGELCADHIFASNLPEYASDLSLDRYKNKKLIQALYSSESKGLL